MSYQSSTENQRNRRPQSQRPQMPPVASQVVAMTTNGAPGDDKVVQPAIPCFQFEKKKYSNNMVEKVLLYISVMRISQ